MHAETRQGFAGGCYIENDVFVDLLRRLLDERGIDSSNARDEDVRSILMAIGAWFPGFQLAVMADSELTLLFASESLQHAIDLQVDYGDRAMDPIHFIDLVHPDDREALLAYFANLDGSSQIPPFVRIERADGRYLRFRIEARELGLGSQTPFIDESDMPGKSCKAFACTLLYIDTPVEGELRSDLCLTEDAGMVVTELRNLRTAPPFLNAIVYCLTGPHELVSVTDRFCALMGCTKAEFFERYSMSSALLFTEEDRAAHQEMARKLCEEPGILKGQAHLLAVDGSSIQVVKTMRSSYDSEGMLWGYMRVTETGLGTAVMREFFLDDDSEQPLVVSSDPDEAKPSSSKPCIEVRTFGYFDVFVDGNPIAFRSEKAKELLALLVDRRGGFVTSREIMCSLWENEAADKCTLARARKAAMQLREELEDAGVADMIEYAPNGSRRVVPRRISCDLYDYLKDDAAAKEAFAGAYMSNYSWSEATLSVLTFSSDNLS